jgi:hypothetical protein
MKWTTKAIILLAAALLFFTLLACDEGRAGYCEAPTPCGAAQGSNP